MSMDEQVPKPYIVGHEVGGDLSVSAKGLYIRIYPKNAEFTCTLTLNYQVEDVGYPVTENAELLPSAEHPDYVEQEIIFNTEAEIGRVVTVKATVNVPQQGGFTSFGETYTLVS